MKPLFDHNLSDRLPRLLADLYPDAGHVLPLGLNQVDDLIVRGYAATNGFTVFTKDGDFPALAVLHGIPPKVVWVQLGNCPTRRVVAAVRACASALQVFDADPVQRVFVIR